MTIEEIAKKYDLRMLVQFGSSIRGKTRSESDIDFAYLAKYTLLIEDEGKLILDLAKSFNICIEKIDLTSLQRAKNPLFLFELFKNAAPLYAENATIFDKYKLYSIHRYLETKKYRRLTDIFLKTRAQKYRKALQMHP